VAGFEHVQLVIDVPKRVHRGEPVTITLTVRNTGDRSAELYVTGRPVAFDLAITSSDGTLVWRRLKGETVTAILQILELAPGSTLDLRDEWLQRTNEGVTVEPGSYKVVGELPLDGRTKSLTSPPMTFEIVSSQS
jgi:hypothetical protein